MSANKPSDPTRRTIYQVVSRIEHSNQLEAEGQDFFNDKDSAIAFVYGQIAQSQQLNQHMIGDVEYLIVELPVVFTQDFRKER